MSFFQVLFGVSLFTLAIGIALWAEERKYRNRRR